MDLFELKNIRSRSASAENPAAETGNGGRSGGGRKGAPCLWPVRAGDTVILVDQSGPGVIRHIWCTIPPGNPEHLRNAILRIYWDGQDSPSVEVPLGDFFGGPHGRQEPVQSDLVAMQCGKGFNCWIPMPFLRRAVITVENDAPTDIAMLFYQVDFTLDDEVDGSAGYFHAQFRRDNPCPLHEDFTILDGVEGRGRYLGTVIGVRSTFRDTWWGEGELKFFLDGDGEFPTICGTGTEDYMGSAWGLDQVSTPFQGAPLVDGDSGHYSLYRFHIPDPIYFQERLRVTVQQMGFGLRSAVQEHYGDAAIMYPAAGSDDPEACYFDRSDDYSSVAYWYQTLPSPEFPPLPDRAARSADLT